MSEDNQGRSDLSAEVDYTHLKQFTLECAEQLVCEEVRELRRLLEESPESFDYRARQFYPQHIPIIRDAMCVSKSAAANYAAKNLKMLQETPEPRDKSGIIDWIEDTCAERLSAVCLGIKDRKELAQ